MTIALLRRVTYFLILLPFGLLAQTAPKYSNEFLSIGVGARSFAMANTSLASVNDVTASYWNPAALVNLDKNINLGLMHAEYFAGLSKYDYGALSFKVDEESSLAFSFIRFAVDNIPNTLELIDSDGNIRFDRIKSFSVADYAFYFSYARKLAVPGLNIGGNAKIIRRIGGDFASSWGFGIDAAASYTLKNWKFGLMLRDITTSYNSWVFNTDKVEDVFELTGNVIPTNSVEITLPKIMLGAAYSYDFLSQFGVLAEVNLDISTDGKRNVLIKGDPFSIDPHMGLELNYNQLVFLRAGVGNIQQEYTFQQESYTTLQPNMGLGLRYKDFAVDYAITDLGNVSAAGFSHIVSLSYAFNKLKLAE